MQLAKKTVVRSVQRVVVARARAPRWQRVIPMPIVRPADNHFEFLFCLSSMYTPRRLTYRERSYICCLDTIVGHPSTQLWKLAIRSFPPCATTRQTSSCVSSVKFEDEAATRSDILSLWRVERRHSVRVHLPRLAGPALSARISSTRAIIRELMRHAREGKVPPPDTTISYPQTPRSEPAVCAACFLRRINMDASSH